MIFANLSGGRDSTAMVIRWLELGNKLDYILFCDTGYEFNQMYEYIKKLDLYLKTKFDKEITYLKAEKSFYDMAFKDKITRGDRIGMVKGIPRKLGHDYCTRDLKIVPSKKFVLSKSNNRFMNTILIGYTKNEILNGRISNLDYAIAEYPLSDWGWNEVECEEFLKKRGIANPLYKHFNRTGCFLCPKQNINSFYSLYKYYPKKWAVMKAWEAKAKELNAVNQTFNINQTLESLEKKFIEKDKDPTLDLDYDYKYDEVCFCK